MSKSKDLSAIGEQVMRDINAGKIAMRPRAYFTLLTALSIATITAAALTIAYLTSIVYFWLRIVTADTMAYGARSRLSESLAAFPWWLLVLAIGLGIAAVLLTRHQGRLYRHRTSTIALLLVLGSLLLGVGLSFMNVGRPFADQHAPQSSQQQGQGRRHNQN